MVKSITIFISCLICVLPGSAQVDSSLTLAKTIKGEFASFAVDQFDNIYILTASNQLKKLDAKGDSVALYNNVRNYGQLSFIDVSNPLRVLLYYKDFSTIVLLDRLLNVRSTIDLRQQNIFQVQAVGLSYDNKLWLYDEFEHKLKKIDEDGKLLFETPDFRQLFNEAFSFTSIFDHEGFLYLYDIKKGAFVFDYYGALKKRIALTGLKNFKAAGKYLLGIRNDSLIRYQPDIFLSGESALPLTLHQATSISFTTGRVYALKKDGLEIYLQK
ncbi:MAG TPA: hypothetical protein VI548_01310 [Chitinophagaceae bacterium]|nr:hypothetical protein [Chitinophagaceae bacterium]